MIAAIRETQYEVEVEEWLSPLHSQRNLGQFQTLLLHQIHPNSINSHKTFFFCLNFVFLINSHIIHHPLRNRWNLEFFSNKITDFSTCWFGIGLFLLKVIYLLFLSNLLIYFAPYQWLIFNSLIIKKLFLLSFKLISTQLTSL